MAKRTAPSVILDNGTIPPLLGDTDVERLVWLLEVGRQRGYQLGPTVQVGTVIAQVRDLRLAAREGLTEAAPTASSIWGEVGHNPDEPMVEGTTGR